MGMGHATSIAGQLIMTDACGQLHSYYREYYAINCTWQITGCIPVGARGHMASYTCMRMACLCSS